MKGTAHNSRTNACAAPIASHHSTYACRCSTGQHQPGRKAGRGAPYLKHGGGVGPTKERVCRFRSHLRAKHRRQFEILAVRFLRVPPLMQSVGAGVMGWVLEQGKCSQNLGQQAVVHRAARRTFESKCCRRSSAQLLRTPPRQKLTERARQCRKCAGSMMWTSSEHFRRTAPPPARLSGPPRARRRGRSSSIGHDECRNPYGV